MGHSNLTLTGISPTGGMKVGYEIRFNRHFHKPQRDARATGNLYRHSGPGEGNGGARRDHRRT